jgi:transposase-like protein
MAHSSEKRAQVLAALLEGQSVTKVAKDYDIPHSTVSRIKRELGPDVLDAIEHEKKERIADLVENHLRDSLKACAAIAQHAANQQWLSRQSASELAVLYGVLTDKSIRILEAAQSAAEREYADTRALPP